MLILQADCRSAACAKVRDSVQAESEHTNCMHRVTLVYVRTPSLVMPQHSTAQHSTAQHSTAQQPHVTTML